MKRILYIFSLFSLLSSAFVAQDDPFTALLKKLEEFTKKYPQEKVYLHLDKPYYAVGDDIWFKAYVVDAKTSFASTLSHILYVELINEKDSITKQIKLPLQSGITWGDFKLSDTLSEGNYRIRAYTQWMRNVGPNFFFDKTIKIGNSWANDVFTTSTSQVLIENNAELIKNKINFLDKSGKPYANAAVSYEVELNDKNISRGKVITNANGDVEFTYANNQLNSNKHGEIKATITLPNKQKITKVIPIKYTTQSIDIQFLPEGGGLVENLPSKVAIKATGGTGLGENIIGRVVDNEQTEILKFETKYLGMGTFILNPLPGKTYKAIVKLSDGGEKVIQLPKAESSGYVLNVNNTDSAKMTIKVMLSADLIGKGNLNLVAQHNGEIYFNTTIPSEKQLVALSVPKMSLPSGIIQITLFSPTHQPVAERLAFVNNPSTKINLTVENLKPTYSTRENVELQLTAFANNKPIQGSFSIAVTNASVVTPDLENESNILTNLLLTSDLVGFIEKPNLYFLNEDLETRQRLDHVLLTQGWRKINWKSIFNDDPNKIAFPAEKSMKISGKITRAGKPVASGKVSLFSNSGGLFVVDTLSDANGNFNFDEMSFGDSTSFIVQARTSKEKKNIQIDLDRIPNQLVTSNKNTGDIEVNVNTKLMPYLTNSDKYFDEQLKRGFLNRTVMLKEVKIIEKKSLSPNSRNLNGPGRADQVITAKELENSFSLSMFLQARAPGVSVRGGLAVSNRNSGQMAIVLDGMKMSNDFLLDDINVYDIESVEILRSIGNTTIYGMDGLNGVIVITTKIGAGTSNNYPGYTPGIITYLPKGYYAVRQFYSPKYDVQPDNKPDYRTTVYWNPHLVTDPSGETKFNYFNTDQSGNYRVVIEGIDAEGNLARKVFTYLVN